VGDVQREVLAFCDSRGQAQVEAGDDSKLTQVQPPIRVSLVLPDAQTQARLDAAAAGDYPETAAKDPFEPLVDPFDDDDEEVAPRGVKRVYVHDHDLLVRTSDKVRAVAHGIKFAREAADVKKTVLDLADELRRTPLVLSFNPPQNQFKAVDEPSFVDPCDNFSIPHLCDLGVVPNTEVFVEFFDPHAQEWSSEVAAAVEASGAVSDDVVDARIVTTKNKRGAVHRFTVATDKATVQDLSRLHFCATGDLPMFHVVAADGGRILGPYDIVCPSKVGGHKLLPSPTLYVVHRPRPWLGEPPVVDTAVRMANTSDQMLNPVDAAIL